MINHTFEVSDCIFYENRRLTTEEIRLFRERWSISPMTRNPGPDNGNAVARERVNTRAPTNFPRAVRLGTPSSSESYTQNRDGKECEFCIEALRGLAASRSKQMGREGQDGLDLWESPKPRCSDYTHHDCSL